MRMKTRGKLSAGVTLVELATVMLIIGVILVSAVSILRPLEQTAKIRATEQNMKKIIDALSLYVQTNNRLPCPARATETNFNYRGKEINFEKIGAGYNIGLCLGSDTKGIVPWSTLNLDEETVKDGWKNYITYKVSAPHTLPFTSISYMNTCDPTFAERHKVHARCRTRQWIDYVSAAVSHNKNPAKAQFCCTNLFPGGAYKRPDNNYNGDNVANCPDTVNPAVYAPANDIQIRDKAGNLIWTLTRDTNAASYNDMNTQLAANPTGNTIVPVVVLVSHGINGHGAFLSAGGQVPDDQPAPDNNEDENADNDNIFVQAPPNDEEGPEYFDDIVMWRTNDNLYSETGVSASCAYP